jgi:cytochrome c oxidase subunit 2
MDRTERLILLAAGFLMAVFFIAIVYAATGLGINVPTCVTNVAPFTEGKVIDKGDNHYEVHVVAKMWAFDPPEVRLPPGAKVDLYLSAKDVTHGLYIEHTNVNLMAVPGAVNAAQVTFDQPEYCGIGHQNMAGKFVIGALPAAAPVAAAGAEAAAGGAELGKQLFAAKGCTACHSIDGKPGVGPTLKGVLGRTEELADGSTVKVDEQFIAHYIRNPNSPQLKNFQPLMPQLPLSDAEVEALVAYVKTL